MFLRYSRAIIALEAGPASNQGNITRLPTRDFSALCGLARRMQRRRALAIGIVRAHEIDRGERSSCNEGRTASQATRSRFHGSNGHKTPARSSTLNLIIILRQNPPSLFPARDFGRHSPRPSRARIRAGEKRSLATGPNLTSVRKSSLVRIDQMTNLLSGKIRRCCTANPGFGTASDGSVWFQACQFRTDPPSVFSRSGFPRMGRASCDSAPATIAGFVFCRARHQPCLL
jgi:hypothetical protein